MQAGQIKSEKYGTVRVARDARGASFYALADVCRVAWYYADNVKRLRKKMEKEVANSVWREFSVEVGGVPQGTMVFTDKATVRAVLDLAENSAKAHKEAITWLREQV